MSIFNPIRISFVWDKENFEKAYEKSYAYQYKHSLRRYFGWFLIALAQFGVVAALKGGTVALLIFSTILLFYWYIVKKWLLHKRALTAFEQSPLKDSTITITVDDKGLKQEDRMVLWEEIKGIVPIEDALLLYYKDKSFYIPERAFASLEEKNRFKSIAKQHQRFFDA